MTDETSARLFVAAPVDAAVCAALLQWAGSSAQGRPGLRIVNADALHITLCFLGSHPLSAIGEIARACRCVAGHARPELVLAGALWLPPRRPRVLAVSLEDGSGSLSDVQTMLAARLHGDGWYRPEHRRYMPHVTVARVRHGARVEQGELAPVPPLRFEVSGVTLMRSHLGPTGAQYEALMEVALGAAP